MRAVFESLGVHDVVAKSQGSSNPYNMVRATFDALAREDSPRSVAQRRNLKVSTMQSRRQGVEADASDSVSGGPAMSDRQDHHARADRQRASAARHDSARR